YQEAVENEEKYRAAYDKASAALSKARQERNLLGQLLESRGVDPASVAQLVPAAEMPLLELPRQAEVETPASINGHLPIQPLSNTHAVFLLMKKYGNAGFTANQLQGYAKKAELGLTTDDVTKVFWRQMAKKTMERTEIGGFRLSAKGLRVNKFRRQPQKESAE